MKKKQEMLLSNFQSQQETVTQEKQVNVIEEMPKKKNERTVDDVVNEKGGKWNMADLEGKLAKRSEPLLSHWTFGGRT